MKARLTNLHRETNPGKVAQLNGLHSEYVSYMQKCVELMIRDQKYNVFPSERKSYFPECAALSSQIIKNAQAQAADLVSTWVSNLYGRCLKKHIQKQHFSEVEQIQLYFVGKYRITKGGTFGRAVVDQKFVDLYWSWVWDEAIVGLWPTIDTSRTPMKLTEMTCTITGLSKEASHFENQLWLRFSTLTRRKTVSVPLNWTPYLKTASDVEKLSLSIFVRKSPSGDWTFQFTDRTPDPVFDGSEDRVGVDVGLNVLAATSKGDIYGSHFKPQFDRQYKKLQETRANRQRQGLKRDSARLRRMEERLSGHIKTAVGTVTNQLVDRHPNTTFVVEDLDLSGCKGQKRFAYRLLHCSLRSKAVVLEVNPAYTSQCCPSCGYVSRKNRSGVQFCCRSCGRKSHADFIGSLNLLRRSEDKQIGLKTSIGAIKKLLRERFRLRRRKPPIEDSSVGAKKNELEPSSRKLTVKKCRTASNRVCTRNSA